VKKADQRSGLCRNVTDQGGIFARCSMRGGRGGAGRGGGGAGEATEGAASVLRDEATPGAAGEAGGDTAREDSHVWCAR
jgi:hypothetical protein